MTATTHGGWSVNAAMVGGREVVEASDLGLGAGCWPDWIEVTGVGLFRRGAVAVDREGEVAHVEYRLEDMVLTVLND